MKPTVLTRISLISEDALSGERGVFATAINHPYISSDGILRQSNAINIMAELVRANGGTDRVVKDITLEELPLETDYLVICPVDRLNKEGVTYALAEALGWRHPVDNRRIGWQDGEFKVFRQVGSVEDLASAYSLFEPCSDLATLMAIILKFRPTLKFDGNNGILDIARYGRIVVDPGEYNEMVEIAREALHAVIHSGGSSNWGGKVPLSMVHQLAKGE